MNIIIALGIAFGIAAVCVVELFIDKELPEFTDV
jgi:hypothetical protein